MTGALLATAFFGGCLLLFEKFLPSSPLSLPWQRKFIHVVMCLAVVISSFLLPYQWFLPIGLFFTVTLILLRRFRPLISLADRQDESFGEILLPLGIALAALMAQTLEIFQMAVLILGLVDTAAYVIGTSLKSPGLIFHKTLAGSGAYIITAIILMVAFQPIGESIVIGCVLGIIELISPKGSDNLTTPVAAALLLGAA